LNISPWNAGWIDPPADYGLAVHPLDSDEWTQWARSYGPRLWAQGSPGRRLLPHSRERHG
jgi:hypothetical protein